VCISRACAANQSTIAYRVDDNLEGAWEAKADSWISAAEAVIGDATQAHKLPGSVVS